MPDDLLLNYLHAEGDAAPQAMADQFGSDFGATVFNNMVIVLDHYFCHRGRGLEGKDGTALNDVRVVCKSLMEHDGVMTADKTIRLKPDNSVLKYAFGERIHVRAHDLRLLSVAFLAEIATKFT
jgi:hypothetical protein